MLCTPYCLGKSLNSTTPFQPGQWLLGPHLQTIWPSLIRRQTIPARQRERVLLPDGDFLDLDWLGEESSAPLVVLLHGLTGSSDSQYIVGLQKVCHIKRWQSVAVNLRGCSGELNRLPRNYHSGDSDELRFLFSALRQRFPDRALVAVGYSLGGNMLLKYLGEQGSQHPLDAAAAVSVPFLLDRCAEKMNTGFSVVYRNRLIRAMIAHIHNKIHCFSRAGQKEHAEVLQRLGDIRTIKTFQEYDHRITAPLHGFSSGAAYYQQSSSRQYLRDIQCPTLILHAKDDPFMTAACIPDQSELSNDTCLEVYDQGGHVGFVSGSPINPQYWLEQRIPAFLNSVIYSN